MRILETKEIKCKEVDQNNVYVITATWYTCNQILSIVNLSKTISKQTLADQLPSFMRKIHYVNSEHKQTLHLCT